MLVLSRRHRQRLMIGDDIEIVVLKVEKSQVQLGIKAPKNVFICRQEIYQALRSENQQSLQSSSKALQKVILSLKKKLLQ